MTDPRQSAFWLDAEAELVDELTGLLVDTYLQGVDGGVRTMPPNLRALVNFDTVNRNAVEFARTYRSMWIKGITDTTRTQVQAAISDWIQSGASLDALDATLAPIFGPDRAEQIARTEVTRVFASGNLAAFESTGMVEEVVWQTAQDDLTCEICSGLDGEHFGVSDSDAMPPAHVNCRCYILPVTSEESIRKALEQA